MIRINHVICGMRETGYECGDFYLVLETEVQVRDNEKLN